MSISSFERLRVRRTWATSAGSTSPDRVPITNPSNGVSPIEVSTLRPAFTAVALAPLPRCSTMQSIASGGRARIRAASRAT